MYSQPELIYSIACSAYVVTCLMFAAVRWFHVCPGAKENKTYYHPDRKIMTVFYTIPIILFPYMFNPASHTSWLLVKGYYPLTHFFYCAVLLFNYFGKVKHWKRWYLSGMISSIMVFLFVTLLFVVALWPNLQISAVMENLLTRGCIVVGLLMTVYSGMAMWQVWQWICEYNTDNFSNIDDFPLTYAHFVLGIPVVHALLVWSIVLFDSPTWLAAIQFLLSVFNVIFLIYILPSKRKGNLFDYAPTEELPHTCCIEKAVKAERKLKEIPQQTRKRISDGIEKVLVQQHLYLNPNLSLKEVVEGCGYSQAYVSRVLREQYGGFYDYVNLLRCRHVDNYAKQHPEVTMEESIIKSGFKNRQTYYRIKKHLFSNDDPAD